MNGPRTSLSRFTARQGEISALKQYLGGLSRWKLDILAGGKEARGGAEGVYYFFQYAAYGMGQRRRMTYGGGFQAMIPRASSGACKQRKLTRHPVNPLTFSLIFSLSYFPLFLLLLLQTYQLSRSDSDWLSSTVRFEFHGQWILSMAALRGLSNVLEFEGNRKWLRERGANSNARVAQFDVRRKLWRVGVVQWAIVTLDGVTALLGSTAVRAGQL